MTRRGKLGVCISFLTAVLTVMVSAADQHDFTPWENRGDFMYRECTICEISETADVIIHTCTFSEQWQSDGESHFHCCTGCGKKGEVTAHSFGEYITVTEATTAQAGKKTRTCAVCGYDQESVIDPLTEPETTEPLDTEASPPPAEETPESVLPAEPTNPTPTVPPTEQTPPEEAVPPTETEPALPVWVNPFIDIGESHPYYDAVRFAHENNLFVGIETDAGLTFAPDMTISRAMFVTVLGRLAGADLSRYTDAEVQFSDVKVGEWYAPYVAWAYENKIVLGYDTGAFGIADSITVEQAAAIIARFAEECGIAVTDGTDHTAAYADAGEISDWAAADLGWCIDAGIYAPDDALLPGKPASRALVADMLCRYVNRFGQTEL